MRVLMNWATIQGVELGFFFVKDKYLGPDEYFCLFLSIFIVHIGIAVLRK